MSRPIYGRVYEVFLRGQPADAHSYVGKVKMPTTIHQRIWGKSSSAHTSPESIAKDPWKADIRPGRAGYCCLEVVYATGDPAEDDARLRRAEADWIYRLRPTKNIVRPVRPPGETATRPRRTPQPAAARRRARRRRPVHPRAFVILALMALFTYLTARVAVYMPWPAAPWVAAPPVGVIVGWSVYWKLHRSIRKALR